MGKKKHKNKHGDAADTALAVEDVTPVDGLAATLALPARDEEKDVYADKLHDLQVELVKLQRHLIESGERLLLLFEGRDAAGKDGSIKVLTEHLSPREMRTVALSKPTERELGSWYFQRWVPHLPAAGEIVCLNRSWYNRAGVERVMGFCTEPQLEEFFDSVMPFEHMLIRSGIRLQKYYLDIDREEQRHRLADRRKDPLKQWKISPIDASAQEHWDEYSAARNEMLARTHSLLSPWTVLRNNHKRRGRLALLRDILSRADYPGKKTELLLPDPAICFVYDSAYVEAGIVAA